MYDLRLMCRIRKELVQSLMPQQTHFLKMGKLVNRHFTKEFIEMVNKHERCMMSLGKCVLRPQ